MGLGRLTVTSAGADPAQEAPKVTEELNPFTEVIVTVVDLATPGVRLITVGDGWVTKSRLGEETTVVPAGVTIS
jgi:hypothetical protein